MFVRESKYDELMVEYLILAEKYETLLIKYNRLITLINSKGGQELLDGDNTKFSKEEIRTLIQLCHPDKHNGKQSAVNITKKLLSLR